MNYYRLVTLLVAVLALPLAHAQPGYDVEIPSKPATPVVAVPKPAPVTGPTSAEKQAQRETQAERTKRLQAEELIAQQAAEIERLKALAAPPQPQPVPATQPAPRPAKALARHPQTNQPLNAKDIITETYGPRMVVIAPPIGGSFTMGSPDNESYRRSDEKQHSVRLTYPFAMAETETTFAQWDACVADSGCNADGDKDKVTARFGRGQQPVINVTHNQARQYADWVNKKLGLSAPYHYRLPSEGEWEYAARAGTRTSRYWGDDLNQACHYANVADEAVSPTGSTRSECKGGYGSAAPVGQFRPNAFALYDMLGNVREWVADCYESDYSKVPADGTAHRENDETCSRRVIRGGGWDSIPQLVRAANRGVPPLFLSDLGFRLARTLPSGS
nr:formylglycine-generating enzyme family protein [Rhodoferax sp.]